MIKNGPAAVSLGFKEGKQDDHSKATKAPVDKARSHLKKCHEDHPHIRTHQWEAITNNQMFLDV